MTDIAIAAISGAGVTIAVALAMLVLGLRASDAEQRCADARVDAANRKAQGAIDSTTIAELRAQLDSEKQRANALDDVANRVPDSVVGSHARVLSQWRIDNAHNDPAPGDAAEPLPATSAAGASDKPKPVG